MKKITIVTVTFNAVSVLENTIKSILSQNQSLFEYIIIDGGSSDGTINIIQKYQNKIDFWKSEKDNGIYDAMNKAIFYSNCEWICFMNAGDIFYDHNVLQNIFFNDLYSNYDIIYGNHAYIKNDNINIINPLKLKSIWKRMPICHQSIFTKTKLLKNNTFKLQYKYASDYDFVLNHYINHPKSFIYINVPISIISLNGLSESNSLDTYFEYMKISTTVFKSPFIKMYFYILIFIRFLIKQLKTLN